MCIMDCRIAIMTGSADPSLVKILKSSELSKTIDYVAYICHG